jgi:hypothetical protein
MVFCVIQTKKGERLACEFPELKRLCFITLVALFKPSVDIRRRSVDRRFDLKFFFFNL